MISKKSVAKVAAITILTTSLMGFTLSDSQAYTYNQNETVYRTGNTVSRSYGSPSTSNTASSKLDSTTPTSTNNTESNRSRTYTNNSYTSTNQNTYYNSSGSTVTRSYGTNYSDASNTTSSNNSSPSTNKTTVSNQTSTTENSTSFNSNSSIDKMLNLINRERINNGLKSLKIDSKLTSVAQLKAADMVKSNYFSHTSPNHGTIHDMIKSSGISYYIAGENIAKAYSIESAHKNFMNSWTHRRAILTDKFTHVGIGIKQDSRGMNIISVMFIEKK